MLLGALGAWPYGYFTLLRWVVCAAAVFVAIQAYGWKRATWVWAFGLVAALFNPLAPVHLSREVWRPVDLATAALFVAAAVVLSGPRIAAPKQNSGG